MSGADLLDRSDASWADALDWRQGMHWCRLPSCQWPPVRGSPAFTQLTATPTSSRWHPARVLAAKSAAKRHATLAQRGSRWRKCEPVLNSNPASWRSLEHAAAGIEPSSKRSYGSFLFVGGFDSHAPPPEHGEIKSELMVDVLDVTVPVNTVARVNAPVRRRLVPCLRLLRFRRCCESAGRGFRAGPIPGGRSSERSSSSTGPRRLRLTPCSRIWTRVRNNPMHSSASPCAGGSAGYPSESHLQNGSRRTQKIRGDRNKAATGSCCLRISTRNRRTNASSSGWRHIPPQYVLCGTDAAAAHPLAQVIGRTGTPSNGTIANGPERLCRRQSGRRASRCISAPT